MKKVLTALATLLIASTAWGSIVLSPGLFYGTSDTDNSGVKSESTSTIIDARFGYVLPMGLYLGGMYSLQSSKFCFSGICSDTAGHLAGPTVGYYSMMGFYTLLTYHILGEEDANTTQKRTGAKGPQIDVGWVFPLSSFFAIGPQLTYKSIDYSKLEGGGTSTDIDYTDSGILPYISLWFMF